MERKVRTNSGIKNLEEVFFFVDLSEEERVLLELDKKYYRRHSIPSLEAVMEVLRNSCEQNVHED